MVSSWKANIYGTTNYGISWSKGRQHVFDEHGFQKPPTKKDTDRLDSFRHCCWSWNDIGATLTCSWNLDDHHGFVKKPDGCRNHGGEFNEPIFRVTGRLWFWRSRGSIRFSSFVWRGRSD